MKCPVCGCLTSRCVECSDPAPIGTLAYCAKEEIYPHVDGSSMACAGCFRFVDADLGGVEGEEPGSVIPWPKESEGA